MICTPRKLSSENLLFIQNPTPQQLLIDTSELLEFTEPNVDTQKIIELQSKRTAEHILRCLNNSIPPTNPENGSPLDSAEVQLSLFQAMIYDGIDRIPSDEEIEAKLKKIIDGSTDLESTTFAKAWVDIRHFVEEDESSSLLDSATIVIPHNKEDETTREDSRANKKRKREPSPSNSAPNEKACYQKLLENEPVGTFLLRPSSFQRIKQSDCLFDFFVITSKTPEGGLKDRLIVKENGRGWTLTGARVDKKTGTIVVDPIREYYPCFFDALTYYLKHFSLELKNVRRYSKQQLLEVCNANTLCKKRKE